MAAAERRVRLIDAAKRVIVRDGVAAATTRAVAAEADMSLASLHYVFESQQELMREVVVSAADLQTAFFGSVDLGDAARDQIGTLLESLVDWAASHRNEVLAGYEIADYAMRTPGLGDLARVRIDAGTAVVQELVERFRDTFGPLARPVDEIAKAVFAISDGLVISYLSTRDEVAAKRTARTLAPYIEHLLFGTTGKRTSD